MPTPVYNGMRGLHVSVFSPNVTRLDNTHTTTEGNGKIIHQLFTRSLVTRISASSHNKVGQVAAI